MQIAFAEKDILNELIDTSGYDMQQCYANDAQDLPRGYAILFTGEMENEDSRE